MVLKEHEVEKKHNWNRSLKNIRIRRRESRKLCRRKRWIILFTRTSELLLSLTPKRH